MSSLAAGIAGLLSGLLAGYELSWGLRFLARIKSITAMLWRNVEAFRKAAVDEERQRLLFRFGKTLLPLSVACMAYFFILLCTFSIVPYLYSLHGWPLLTYVLTFSVVSTMAFIFRDLFWRSRKQSRESPVDD